MSLLEAFSILRPPKVRLGIRGRIGLLVLSIVAILGIVYFFLARQAAEDDVRQALEYRLHVASSSAKHFDEVFLQAYDYFVDMADAHGEELARAAILSSSERHSIKKGTLSDVALLVGKDGKVVQSDADHPELVGLDLSSSDYVRRAFNDNQPMALPVIDPVDKSVAAASIAPVKSNGETVAVLVGYVKLSAGHIVDDLRSISPGKTGYVDLIDQNATVLASTDERHIGESSDHANALRMDLRSEPASIGILADESNPARKDVVATASLSAMPWRILIEQDEEEALFQSRILQHSIIIFGLGALIFVIVLGWFTTYYISQPIRSLTAAAKRLSEGDLDTAIRATGGVEISTLASTMERMRANILQLLERSSRSYKSSIRLLATVIDARDEYTATHSTDVSLIASKIAQKMGLAEQDIETIETAALVHDIGKIGVDDTVLSKPGALSPAEKAAMMAHASMGASILRQMEDLHVLVPLVKHHHEWYNGRGYPDGLVGDEIPLGARILSVADALSAMTSNRPYRNALSMEQAESRLRAGKGTQFDPMVVDALIAVIEKGNLYFQTGFTQVPRIGSSSVVLAEGEPGSAVITPEFVRCSGIVYEMLLETNDAVDPQVILHRTLKVLTQNFPRFGFVISLYEPTTVATDLGENVDFRSYGDEQHVVNMFHLEIPLEAGSHPIGTLSVLMLNGGNMKKAEELVLQQLAPQMAAIVSTGIMRDLMTRGVDRYEKVINA